MPAAGRTLSRKKKLLWGTMTCAVLLCMPEVVLRALLFKVDVPRPGTVCAWPGADEQMQDLSFFLQPDKDCFYDLRPGAAYSYFATPMDVINSEGFRGPPVPVPHECTFRIAGLGDSSTFGMCVSEQLTWVRQLEGLLRERFTGKPIDAINAGVIGYSVYQGLRKYETKVRRYKPDLVLIAFGAINDLLPALGASDLERSSQWECSVRSHLGGAAEQLWKLRTVQFFARGLLESRAQLRQQLIAKYYRNQHEFEQGKTYQPRLSHDEFEQCLSALLEAVRTDGAVPILVNPHRRATTEQKYPQVLRLSEIVFTVGRDQGVAVFDCNELFKRDPNYEVEYFADTHHPNARGNRLIAEALGEFLVDYVR